MKSLIFLLCLAATAASGYYDPTMRMHFGAGKAVLRMQVGYFKCPGETFTSANKEDLEPRNQSMLHSMRMQMETLLLLNNRGNFSESVMHTAPRFINIRSQYDGLQKTAINSVSFAQGLPCLNNFPFFGQVKGYWSIGASNRLRTQTDQMMNPGSDIGARAGLNIYNPNSSLQAEVHGFSNNVVVNVLVHRKLAKHLLLSSGVEYNQAVLGLSLLTGSCRFNANTRYCHASMQYGFQMTVNL